MLPKDPNIEDVKEIELIELFRAWVAKLDVLEKSGMKRNDAVVLAWMEVYHPQSTVTDDE